MRPLPMKYWTSLYSPPPTSDNEPLSAPTIPLLVTSGGHYWRPVETCSLEDPPKPILTSGGDTESCTIAKRAVRILLECFLVY